jgi:hypothetical protein
MAEPYSKWSAEKKIQIANELLAQMTWTPKTTSTTSPGPLTFDQMIYLAEVYKQPTKEG